MPVNLGPDFETQVATMAGLQQGDYDDGSVQIDFLNPAGATTVKITVRYQMDTEQLKDAIRQAAPASE